MTFQMGAAGRSVADYLGIDRGALDRRTLIECAFAFGMQVWDLRNLIFETEPLSKRCRYIKRDGSLCGDRWGPTPEGLPRCQHHRDKQLVDFREELLDPANSDLQEIALTFLVNIFHRRAVDAPWLHANTVQALNLKKDLDEGVKHYLRAQAEVERRAIQDIWS